MPRLSIEERWKAYDEDNWEKLEEFQKSELFAQNDMFWHMKRVLEKELHYEVFSQ